MGGLLSILSYFYDIKKELEKKIYFYNQSSSICQNKKPSSVEFGVCFNNGTVKLINTGKDLNDTEQAYLAGNYSEVSVWVDIIYDKNKPCLRFQYYKNGNGESLYYGPYIESNKSNNPVKYNNLAQYGRLFNWFCTNKPALILYSAFHYGNNKKLVPKYNTIKINVGNQSVLFHTKCWLFAEHMGWMMSSVKGQGGQFAPDDVANWMYFGWTLI